MQASQLRPLMRCSNQPPVAAARLPVRRSYHASYLKRICFKQVLPPPYPHPPTQPSSLRLPLGLHSGRKGCSGRSVGAVGALGARPASTCGARPTERSAATLVTILVMRQETVLVMTPLTRLHWSAGSMGTTLPMTLVTAPVMAPSARSWESGAWVVKGSGVGGLGASIRGVS